MSSRRKSRPVRRLDLICSNLQQNQAVVDDQQIPFESYQHSEGDSATSPCDENLEFYDGNNLEVQQQFTPITGNNAVPTHEGTSNTERKKNYSLDSRPPEGVYILQPQGFSDDEGIESSDQKQEEERSERKRVRDVENSISDCETPNSKLKPGLDLSVKRQKTYEDEGRGSEDNQFTCDGEVSNNYDENVQTRMEKYQRFMELLGQQTPLIESMTKSGLTQHDLIAIRQMKSVTKQEPEDLSENETSFSTHQGTSTASVTSTWNPPSWQDANAESNLSHDERSPPPSSSSQLQNSMQPFSSPSLPPAVAAAFMASIVSNTNDQNPAAATSKAEFLQKIFNRSSAFSQVASSVGATPNIKYSDNADAVDTITSGTVSSGVGSIKKGTLDPTNFDEDVFDKYISKYSAKHPCMQASCPHINRDHYHCTDSDCNFQRFTNKSDVIRHYNMHKKRDNSLAHGFMRFAPTDDCSRQFGNCHLNGKSTHYHCLHTNCSKVYTSTSDVMTHENFHKKNQQFVSNGFERYRATETCGMMHCPFASQRTTHFHCTRPGCNFTFKNKCDIEKHKAYHTRDDAYTRQGFKKFYKNESCQFQTCAWNRTANHFHCLRQNCGFSFTSTSQMVSHKRKHDRQDIMGSESLTSTSPTHSSTSIPSTHPTTPSTAAYAPHLPPAVMRHQMISQQQQQSSMPLGRVQPYLDIRGKPRTPILMPSFIYPYVASRLLNRPVPSMVLESRGQSGSKFDSSMLHEAARKVLASIPTTGAAALPHSLSGFSPKVEPRSLPAAFAPSTSASPVLPPSGEMKPEMSSTPRQDTPRSLSGQYNLPPAYNDQMEPSTYKNESHYEQESDQAEQMQWSEKKSPVPAQPERTRETFLSFNEDQTQNHVEEQALNLSSKNDSTSSRDEKFDIVTSSDKPSKAVLKFFRGLGPDECSVPNCVFSSCHHFHCAVENCCAVFTEKQFVLTHTTFHEKLEQSGFEQKIARQFSPVFPQTNEEPSHKPPQTHSPNQETSPPSGYPQQGEGDTQRNIVLSRAQFDQSREDNHGNEKPVEYSGVSAPVSLASYADNPVYKYLSRMVAEKKMLYPTLNPEPRSTNAYMVLQNPGLMSKAMMSSGGQTVQEGIQSQLDLVKSMSAAGSGNEDGFIHIRPGMTCIRRDCKYMMQNHWHCTLNRCRYVCKSLGKAQTHRQAHDSLEAYARAAKECFRSYTVKKMCPNPSCEFRLRGHYHCLKPGCQFVTIGTSKLPWHMKKHEKIARREASGFKYYTKKEQCGKYDCKYNGLFSHYHCIRAGCAFAFQYKHQMSTHVRKHLRRMLGRSYNGMDMTSDSADIDHSNVDSGDDSLPLIVDEADEIEQRPGVAMDTSQATASSVTSAPYASKPNFMHELSRPQLAMLEQIAKGGKGSYAPPRGGVESSMESPRSTSLPLQSEINDVSSDEGVLDLRANFPDTDSNSNESNSKFSNDMPSTNGDSPDKMQEEEVGSYQYPEQDIMNRFIPKSSEESPSMFAKFRINNDVLDGFRRFESSENCGDTQCPHAFKVAHYHCTRESCAYRFTGRTHMFKHQQHHERVAGLVRDDFKRFKTTQDCEVEGCQYRATSTHFHCLRCQFKCTDSAKVGTHRRQHVKADTLEQSGFERFRGKEDCMRDNCKYRHRNTSHFHCLQSGCSYSVVGLSGIEQHSNKHKRGFILAQVCNKAGQEIEYNSMTQSRNPPTHAESSFGVPSSSGDYRQYNSDAYAQMNNANSPVPDDRISPQFNASAVVTSQFNPNMMQVNQAPGAMDLSDSLNLAVNQTPKSGVTNLMTGYHAGLGLS